MEIKDIEQMELVKFEDGKFGIRRNGEYLDLVTEFHWWKPTSEFYKDCRADEDATRHKLNSYKIRVELSKDLGEVVE